MEREEGREDGWEDEEGGWGGREDGWEDGWEDGDSLTAGKWCPDRRPHMQAALLFPCQG